MREIASRKSHVKTIATLAAAAVLSLSILAACGGGGGGSSSSSSSGTTSTTTGAAATTLTGTVAVGSALAGATVTVTGANGVSVTTTTDASGNYSVSIAGLTAPFVIVATDPTGAHSALVSVVASLPSNSSAPVVANVTTLTSAVAALLTSSGNPLELVSSTKLSALVTTSTVQGAVSKLNTLIAPILSANGISSSAFDPIGGAFAANQTGADAVIDAVTLTTDASGGCQLVSSANSGNGVSLSSNTNVNTITPLSAPPVAVSVFATLTTELSQCLAGTSSACSQAIDASYLDNGFTSFTAAHTALASTGVTVGLPQPLQFFTTSGGTQKALVIVPYKTSSGGRGFELTTVQQLSSGSWDIIGNQQPFNVTITSFLARRQFVDSTDQPFSRFESGIAIRIPAGAAGTPNPASLAAASVTGPGINGTVFLVPRNGTGNDLLALTSTAQSSAPTGNATTSSNTNLYRWSWQSMLGASSTFVPGTSNLGFYTPSPIDVSTVSPFATYTVTFFDSTGTQIGSAFSVVNPTVAFPSSSGFFTPWPSLTPDTIANVLTPGGSESGAQATADLAWSTVFGGFAVNFGPLVTKAQVLGVPGTAASSTAAVEGWVKAPASFSSTGQYSATVTAGVDQSGTQECTSSCSFPALQSGGSRSVELYWPAGVASFYDIWTVRD
ncbi:hypothetical protein FAZ69_15855 [Trinickia terrae]|uniref:Carboxypeptidase regulatory-like domain-containing protein n=1 Tax=Trinickia terrae TaxID=2571161 RepID=A0A4U1I3E7_9BURK|nr:hypothetical protein [Trinickia terrae]TKC87756.1 hypothetical protein FAZ69_15855 [Trinickia terrae]